jgi:putative FmdB family regulatory protein
MPFFEYECPECKTVITTLHQAGEEKEKVNCPRCEEVEMKRVYSPFYSGPSVRSCGGCGEGYPSSGFG